MNISWNDTVNKLCGDYFDKLSDGLAKASLNEESRTLVTQFLHHCDNSYNEDYDVEGTLRNYAETHGIEDISCLFEGELKEAVVYILGEDLAAIWQRYMRITADSPYTEGYYRRSVRSRLATLHINNSLVNEFKSFVIIKASGFSVADTLRGGRTPEEAKEIDYYFSIDAWLAAMIDSGNRECIEYLKEAMFSENNANRMGYGHFRAIAKSGNEELLEAEGRLLLAARLQEGLRQAIVETMDQGRTASFIHLLKVIMSNNLQRFAAVKRGIAVATGLGEIDAPERITDKYFELVWRYVNSPRDREQGVESDDAMEVYLSLWAIAFHDVMEIERPVVRLIESAPAYRVEAAMLMVGATAATELKRRIASKALEERGSEHSIMAGALPMYLTDFGVSYYGEPGEVPELGRFFSSREEAIRDLDILVRLLESLKPKETFSPYVFPWMYMEISRGEVAAIICKIALLLGSDKYKEDALVYVGYIEPYQRAGFIKYLLAGASTRKQISFAVEAMTDRGEAAREAACEIVKRLHNEGRLTAEDYMTMESHLRLKASSMRVAIISILSSFPDADALASAKRLLSDKTADRRLAGLDMLKTWIDKGERQEMSRKLLAYVDAISRPTTKEKVLMETIHESLERSDATYNSSNGFGLYNPDEELKMTATVPDGFDAESALTFADPGRARSLMLAIMDIIEKNADYEFTNSWGEKQRLGNCVKKERYGRDLDALAMPEVWQEFYEKEIGNPTDMLRLLLATSYTHPCHEPFFAAIRRIIGKAFHQEPMDLSSNSFLAAVKRKIGNVLHQKPVDTGTNPFYGLAYEVCECLFNEYCDAEEIYKLSADVMAVVATRVETSELTHKYKEKTTYWQREEINPIYTVWPLRLFYERLRDEWKECGDELFAESFSARYELYRRLGYKKDFNTIIPLEYLRLWNMGKITDSEFWHEMLGREDSPSMVMNLTLRLPGAPKRYSGQPDLKRLSPAECELVNAAVDRILDIELKRGDTPTAVSHLAKEIRVVKGADYFIAILLGLGKDKPVNAFYNIGDSKKAMFSHLLNVCCPTPEDTPENLKKLVKEAGISDERLVEAAMFSPRWLELVEQTIGWKGLTSAAYYFLAHTGDYLDENVKSHISRYTAVAPDDFVDGAFDPGWFHEVYRQLGAKRFDVVYDAAKYIAEGNRHTRARKLSDAVLGKFKVKEVAKEIADKRNKDLVVALGLIPLGRNRMKDLRQRYDLLNGFLKESKQFGAQRQASEGRAVKLALDNLARTAGFGDATRMTWSLESDLVKEIAEFLSPKDVDGVSACIQLNEDAPALVMESKGKRLQSIPARLKKDKYVARLKEVYKQLKDQNMRGRVLLEKAMTESSAFTGEEIARLRENPIIWGMLSRLVMVSDDRKFGFPGGDGASLISADGEVMEIAPDASLRIAHPYDMMKGGVWSEFQKALFDRCWRQPFKQVFRELYVPTADENENWKSMRYAGNQIMPARAVAMLKKRQWIVDYENGLQKVCFHGDVTAVMYAMADWFSPSDMEAPTLEYVAFYDRRSFKEKKISEVLPIVFSEIMRDVDLAVSVAHAGGVDPETSHSTIEMRRAIVEHAMPMFGLENVAVSGNFAKVAGTLASYNIHLGSGVIHKEGGAQIAVLPVHSQSRGRIFLPFLDEDPKTAEIISKILLFAEDSKIKDPSILNQI